MDEWYYALSGAQQGPVQRAVLMQLLSSGNIPPNSLVWREGMTDWLPANSIAELNAPSAAYGARLTAVPMATLNYGVGASAYAPAAMNYAGFGARFGAWVIDFIVILVASFGVGAVIGFGLVYAGGGSNGIEALRGLSNIMGMVVSWLYYSLMQSSPAQGSLGMMAVGLRVADENGQRITFGRATGRYFASLLSGCLLFIGYLMMLWSPRNQTLHDQLAGTVVIYK